MRKILLVFYIGLILVGCQTTSRDVGLSAPRPTSIDPTAPQEDADLPGNPFLRGNDIYQTETTRARQPQNPYGDDFISEIIESTQVADDQNAQNLPAQSTRANPFISTPEPQPANANEDGVQPTEDMSLSDRLSSFLSSALGGIADDGRLRVGLFAPMSGPHKEIGKMLLQTSQIALLDLADDGFILMPFDTKGTPDGTVDAFREAVDKDVDLILGPLFSKNAQAISPYLASEGINAIALTNDTRISGGNLFVMGMSAQPQIIDVARFAAERGIEKYAALVPDTEYGRLSVRALNRVLDFYELEEAHTVFYEPGQDVKKYVQEIANYEERQLALEERILYLEELLPVLDPEGAEYPLLEAHIEYAKELDTYGPVDYEAILLIDTGDSLRQLAPLLSFYDVDLRQVQLMGVARWEEIQPWTDLTFHNAWFAGPDPTYRKKFESQYVDLFRRPPSRLATVIYDATALAAVLGRRENGARVTKSEIRQPNGFVGLDGIFRFNSSNQVERGLAILQVTPKGLKVISPAPNTFAKTN